MKKKGAKILVESLIELGIDTVFGFPGSAVLDIYDELYKHRNKIKHILTAHEQGACHAADGYARASGKIGVVIATSGPGATNLVTGIAAANLDSSPLLVITGNAPLSQIGTDSFQEVDTMDITMPITKHNYIVKDVNKLKSCVYEAYDIALSTRPGPVLVDIPKDIQSAFCEADIPPQRQAYPIFSPSDEAISLSAKLIEEANNPFIYIGGGSIKSGAENEIKELSRRLCAPVGASLMGLCAVEHDFPYFLGITGMYERELTSEIKKNADLIIGLGVRFSDRAACDENNYKKDVKILHIDIDACEINKRIDSTLGIRSDVKLFLQRLLPKINVSRELYEKRKHLLDDYFAAKPKKRENDELSPQFIINTLQKYCEDDTLICTDVGQHQLWTAKYYHFKKPRTFITNGGLGAMGFGMGAAIGASVACGTARCVLITGDGSFAMNCNELCTAVSNKLPITIIIMNNSSLGLVRQWQTAVCNSRYAYSDINRKTDFTALAKAYGADGETVYEKNKLDAALSKAFSKKAPFVIDCRIDKNAEVLPMHIENGRARFN